jgi:hypothetical protein
MCTDIEAIAGCRDKPGIFLLFQYRHTRFIWGTCDNVMVFGILELKLDRHLRPSWAMFVARCASSDMVLRCARGGTKTLVIAGWVIEGEEGLPVFVQPVFKDIATSLYHQQGLHLLPCTIQLPFFKKMLFTRTFYFFSSFSFLDVRC